MAASDAIPVPRKNTAFRLSLAIRKNDGTLITSWAGADSEVSLDGGTFSDCSNEVTEIGTSGCGYIDLTAAEMNADTVIYKLTVTNTDALPIVIVINPEEAGDYRVDTVQISASIPNDWITAAGIATDAIDNNAIAASAVTEIVDGLLKRDFSEVTGESARSMLNALRFLRNKWSISTGTLTVTKEDDSTTAWTAALTSSAGADPVTAIDPS